MPCRKDYRDLTETERARFVEALNYLKTRGVIDHFGALHVDFFETAHGGSSFLPWHREFLRLFEIELRKYDPRISIPYWDWTSDRNTNSLLWSSQFLGVFDSQWGLGRNLDSDTLATQQMVQDRLPSTPYSSFVSIHEIELHNPPHRWVSGKMVDEDSPRDPVFYLHHCFVDLIWAQWQLLHPGELFQASGGTGGEDIDEAMAPWSTTPEDMLSHRQIGTYKYPSWMIQDQPIAIQETFAVNFNEIPEGETAIRAAVFDLNACGLVSLRVSSGPNLVTGPPETEFGVLESPVTNNSELDTKGRIWFTYKGTNPGDNATGDVEIEVVETGEKFNVDLTANTITRPTAAIALALDQSNSMSFDSGISGIGEDYTRGQVLQFSAPPAVDVLYDDNAIAVFTFDHDTHLKLGMTPINGTGRLLANAAVAAYSPNPDGWTSIGEAIAYAHNLMQPVTGYEVKAIVVLTDGKENHGDHNRRYISDVSDMISERVYAIGLGRAENIEPVALEKLCNSNKGYLLLTGDLDENAYFRLAKYYLQILAGVTNQDIVLDPMGWIASGQHHRIPFFLNETDIIANAVLVTPFPSLIRFSLETPSGDFITSSEAAAHASLDFRFGSYDQLYQAFLPFPINGSEVQSGKWHAHLLIDDKYHQRFLSDNANNPEIYQEATTHGYRYNFSVQAYSNLRMNIQLSQDSYEPGASLYLQVVLREYGLPIEGRASVRAIVTNPHQTSESLSLTETAGGVFKLEITLIHTGVYIFSIIAEGNTRRGRPFTREGTRTAAVWVGGDIPPPSTENDPNRYRDRLCRLISCFLNQPFLLKKVSRMGIDVGQLKKCLREFCNMRTPEGTSPARELKSALIELLNDEHLAESVLRVFHDQKRNC